MLRFLFLSGFRDSVSKNVLFCLFRYKCTFQNLLNRFQNPTLMKFATDDHIGLRLDPQKRFPILLSKLPLLLQDIPIVLVDLFSSLTDLILRILDIHLFIDPRDL